MDWLRKLFGIVEKQESGTIYNRGTFSEQTTSDKLKVNSGYAGVEAVNRGINMVVDDTSEINYIVEDHFNPDRNFRVPRKAINRLLNIQPNPYQDISSFRRNLLMDFLVDGNAFIYFNGVDMYRLPARDVTIKEHKTEYIDYYEYFENKFSVDEIIHIKDNSMGDMYRGVSRLKASQDTMKNVVDMKKFQGDFFKNSAILGLVIETENTLSDKHKSKLLEHWANTYKPGQGAKRPTIVDGGLKVRQLTDTNLREMDFQEGQQTASKIILESIGVPYVLISSGNNNTVRPNMRLYYLETILPIVNKFKSAYEFYFNYVLKPDTSDILALQPELREEAQYYTTLVNGGVFTPNEAREALNKEPHEDEAMDDIRVPANIAGSAVDPSEGGRPEEDDEEEE